MEERGVILILFGEKKKLVEEGDGEKFILCTFYVLTISF